MVDPRLILALAAATPCCIPTARDYLNGRDPRGHLLNARLRDAMKTLGIQRESATESPRKAA